MDKRTNESWISDLRAGGESQALALQDLRSTLLAGLPYALSGWLSPSDPGFEPLTEEVTQEALLKVLANLDTFEGRSQFTTWAHKIAVNIALSKLRRRRWTDVSLEALAGEDGGASRWLAADSSAGPDELVRHWGSTRNALYKLVFDAREHLKRRLQAEGLDPQEVLAAFER